MEYIKTTVTGTNSPEVQNILSDLNTYDDLLLLSGLRNDKTALKISYLTEQGDVVKLGELPQDIIDKIENATSNDVWVGISDFGKYKGSDGIYKLWVELELRQKHKGIDIYKALIAGICMATAVVSIINIVLSLMNIYRKIKEKL